MTSGTDRPVEPGEAGAIGPTDGSTPARRAADAVRSLMRAMVHSSAPPDLIDEVAAHASRLTTQLAPHARTSRYEGTPGATVRPGDNTAIMETHTVVGPANPMAPPLVLERFADRVVGRVRYTLQYEGPPGMLHGGYLGTAFDYVLAAASSLSGLLCMTASMTVNYRAATPIDTDLVFEAHIDRVDGRKVFTVATCVTPDGTLTADAAGLFIAVAPSRYQFQEGSAS